MSVCLCLFVCQCVYLVACCLISLCVLFVVQESAGFMNALRNSASQPRKVLSKKTSAKNLSPVSYPHAYSHTYSMTSDFPSLQTQMKAPAAVGKTERYSKLHLLKQHCSHLYWSRRGSTFTYIHLTLRLRLCAVVCLYIASTFSNLVVLFIGFMCSYCVEDKFLSSCLVFDINHFII